MNSAAVKKWKKSGICCMHINQTLFLHQLWQRMVGFNCLFSSSKLPYYLNFSRMTAPVVGNWLPLFDCSKIIESKSKDLFCLLLNIARHILYCQSFQVFAKKIRQSLWIFNVSFHHYNQSERKVTSHIHLLNFCFFFLQQF